VLVAGSSIYVPLLLAENIFKVMARRQYGSLNVQRLKGEMKHEPTLKKTNLKGAPVLIAVDQA
jgi:hypothetical protein